MFKPFKLFHIRSEAVGVTEGGDGAGEPRDRLVGFRRVDLVKGSGFGVEGSGFRVQSLEFMVSKSQEFFFGLRVWQDSGLESTMLERISRAEITKAVSTPAGSTSAAEGVTYPENPAYFRYFL